MNSVSCSQGALTFAFNYRDSSILCNNSYKWMQYGLSFVALLEIYAVMVKKGTWKGS